MVPNSTFVAQVALDAIWGMRAASIGVAGIVGTDIAVFAIQLRTWNALPSSALIPAGANAVIGARQAIVHIRATSIRETGISGAGITIVTAQGTFRNASAALTVDAQQTGIFQLAGS